MPVGYSIYIEKPSYVHQRIDPRTKLFALCTSFVLALLFNNPAYLTVLLVAVIAIGLWAKLPLKSFLPYMVFALWFLILGILIWPFYIHQGPVVITIDKVQFTSAGLLFGLAMGLRVGLPYKAGMAMSATIRFVPLINAERATIIEAQRARGLDLRRGNPFLRAVRYVAVIGPMLVRALDLAQSLALAMEARAFGARDSRTNITEIRLTRIDKYIMIGCALLIAVAIAFRILGIGVLIRGYL